MREDIGIVLKSQAFKERDKLVTILTENAGKITGIAKGAIHSKRFGGSLDLFSCSTIRYKESQGSDLVRIDEANTKRDFLQLRNSLENMSAAGYFVDLCHRMTEDHQNVREIFLLLAHYLFLLEEKQASAEIVRSFEIKLLDRLGYGPVLDECVGCGTELLDAEDNPYSTVVIERGGFLCKNCSNSSAVRIPTSTLQWLQKARECLIVQTPDLQFPLETTNEGAQVLQAFLRYHCPGLSQYSFRSHTLLERFLEEAKIQSTAALKSSAT